jgi:hypothetical protein
MIYARRVVRHLKAKREFVGIIEKLRTLGLNTEGDSEANGPADRDWAQDPPTIYFLGGGMGSGMVQTTSPPPPPTRTPPQRRRRC